MIANNNHTDKIKVIEYITFKVNKHDTIYQKSNNLINDTFLTEFVKIEKFQGYSNAYNLGLYFRIKNEPNWKESKQITGMWKTNTKNVFYGDIKVQNIKTLLLFKIDSQNETLKVYLFRNGYYPNKVIIEQLSSKI